MTPARHGEAQHTPQRGRERKRERERKEPAVNLTRALLSPPLIKNSLPCINNMTKCTRKSFFDPLPSKWLGLTSMILVLHKK